MRANEIKIFLATKINGLEITVCINASCADRVRSANLEIPLHLTRCVFREIRLSELKNGMNVKSEFLVNRMQNIKKFRLKGCGLLSGSSRKSWINKIDKSKANQRLGGSLASALYNVSQGVDILRVHDVFETRQAVEVYTRIACL